MPMALAEAGCCAWARILSLALARRSSLMACHPPPRQTRSRRCDLRVLPSLCPVHPRARPSEMVCPLYTRTMAEPPRAPLRSPVITRTARCP